MRRNATLALALIAVLALPATASAKPTKQDKKNAAKECKLERGTTEASKAAFAEKYRNFGACVSTRAKQEAAERRTAKRDAARDCRTERAADATAFAGKYGTNANKRNAFGKCVSAKARDEGDGNDPDSGAGS